MLLRCGLTLQKSITANSYVASLSSIVKCRISPTTCRFSSISKSTRQRLRSFTAVQSTKQLLRKTITDAAAGTIPASSTRTAQRYVGSWLLGCAGMTFGAIVIGAITRLTESGLSMTGWHVIKGMKPPRTQEEWEEEFERYKQFPEYKYLGRELTLEGFKRIFFWEYTHRMWGRTIALVFAVPALIFLRKGWISKSLKPRLAIYFSLLSFQGLLGWYMVKSGLEEKDDVPRVSHYRLASHLSSAIILYVLFLWSGLSHLLTPQQVPNTRQFARLRLLSHGGMALVFAAAISGALVAGLDAGLSYNTWPKMADRWIPSDLASMTPKWKNIVENSTTVQFNHRHLGEFTGMALLGLWWLSRRAPLPPRARMAANAMAGMALIQVGLGIATLLTFVPVHLAATHQGGAITLLSCVLWLANELKKMPK